MIDLLLLFLSPRFGRRGLMIDSRDVAPRRVSHSTEVNSSNGRAGTRASAIPGRSNQANVRRA
jgi:hypothetical protein